MGLQPLFDVHCVLAQNLLSYGNTPLMPVADYRPVYAQIKEHMHGS